MRLSRGSQVETIKGRKRKEKEEVTIRRDEPGADGQEKSTLRTDNYSRSCPGDTNLVSNIYVDFIRVEGQAHSGPAQHNANSLLINYSVSW